MKEGIPSRTAMMTAQARGAHRLLDDAPFVLDDPFGLLLIGPDWPKIGREDGAAYTREDLAAIRAFVVARQRFAEERLINGGFQQYVILGAGLDSFVWRRPDLARRMRIIEIDHPATQDFKRRRAESLGLTVPRGHRFIAVDFERETLDDALTRSDLDPSLPVFFSWIGVTMYISRAASLATLKAVSRCAAGSEIVFTYTPPADELGPDDRRRSAAFASIAGAAGEPPIAAYSQSALFALAAEARLEIVANPTRDDLAALYFTGRSDGLAPYAMERVAAARAQART